MGNKVVSGKDMYFEDDVQVIESECKKPLGIPMPLPVFGRDEPILLYNGKIFSPKKTGSSDWFIKVYGKKYGLFEEEPWSKHEQQYFSKNRETIEAVAKDFVERSIQGYDCLDELLDANPAVSQVSNILVSKIGEVSMPPEYSKPLEYKGTGKVSASDDSSVFNSNISGCERALIFDGRIYLLETMADYISRAEKSFEPGFYKRLSAKADTMTPEDLHKMLTDNSGLVQKKALPLVRDKIWHNNNSFQLYIDGIYWVPMYAGKISVLEQAYTSCLEAKVKQDAAKGCMKND